MNLFHGKFDDPMGEATGAAAIFGTTGGVMEAALRTAQDVLTGKDLKEIEKSTLILPNYFSTDKKVLDDWCSKENIILKANYEASNDTIMKKMILNDIGIGFTNKENLKDIKDKIIIIKEFNSTEEGIATLDKTKSNKATKELIKKIKQHYKQK